MLSKPSARLCSVLDWCARTLRAPSRAPCTAPCSARRRAAAMRRPSAKDFARPSPCCVTVISARKAPVAHATRTPHGIWRAQARGRPMRRTILIYSCVMEPPQAKWCRLEPLMALTRLPLPWKAQSTWKVQKLVQALHAERRSASVPSLLPSKSTGIARQAVALWRSRTMRLMWRRTRGGKVQQRVVARAAGWCN